MNEKKYTILNGFALKIIAMILMTLDHVGIFLAQFENLAQISTIFRILGRLALPLFIFLLVEGFKHTKSFWKYFLRVSILEVLVLVAQLISKYGFNVSIYNMESPILDLMFILLFLYLIKRKDKYSFLAILPLGFEILSVVVLNIEIKQITQISWFPFFIRPAYPIFSLILGVGFYYADKLAELFLKSNTSTENLVDTAYARYASNIISAFIVLSVSFILYLFYQYNVFTYWNSSLQVYSCFALIPLLLYSGERGYNSKWFKYGSYLYFPMHIIIIYLIFALI